MKCILEIGANVASILTAVLAGIAFVGYQWRQCQKRRKLEEYLRREKANAAPSLQGLHTVVHLMAELGLTEDEVFQACFRSKHIASKVAVDETTNRATQVLFGYK